MKTVSETYQCLARLAMLSPSLQCLQQATPKLDALAEHIPPDQRELLEEKARKSAMEFLSDFMKEPLQQQYQYFADQLVKEMMESRIRMPLLN